MIEVREFAIPSNVTALGVEQDQPFRHHLERLDQLRVGLIDLLGHEPERAVGAAAVAIGLLVGGVHKLGERVEIDRARFGRRFGELSLKELAHDR